MRITKRQLRQIIREEVNRARVRRSLHEVGAGAYSMTLHDVDDRAEMIGITREEFLAPYKAEAARLGVELLNPHSGSIQFASHDINALKELARVMAEMEGGYFDDAEFETYVERL